MLKSEYGSMPYSYCMLYRYGLKAVQYDTVRLYRRALAVDLSLICML
eukprot:COSAG01_NODE_6270_length_3761_cov_20.095576_7_plen_47_part_00